MRSDNTLYIVIPCYNEEAVLKETAERLRIKLASLIENGTVSQESRVLFADDGSKDKTWEIIEELHKNKLFTGIRLSRNRGHQNALLAGITVAAEKCDMMISMDADLQDDINAIDKMLERYHNGYDIVYGVRSERKKDSVFKKCTARLFYKFMKALGADIIYDHADYRLMSRRAVKGLLEFKETNLFLRGIVPQIGFSFTTVKYERGERFAGESKYPLKKMISFALDGITSFSVKPLRLITFLGLIVSLVSIGLLIWTFIMKFTGSTVPGWSSLMISMWFLGGIQLLSLGVIGEYTGKIYSETKHRPKFIISDILDDED